MRVGVLLIAVLLLAGCGGVSRAGYVAKNEAVVASFPVFPAAVKTHEITTHYVRAGFGRGTKPNAYKTTFVYRVPRGTTAASVQSFYGNALDRRGWSEVNNPLLDAYYKDRELVFVNTPFLSPSQRRLGEQVYEIVADYHGAYRG